MGITDTIDMFIRRRELLDYNNMAILQCITHYEEFFLNKILIGLY